MLCDHEHRNMERRILAPPSLPRLGVPGTAVRPEHIASDNPGANDVESFSEHVVIDTGSSSGLAAQTVGAARCKGPAMQGLSAYAKRMLQALIGPSPIAINRYAEVANAKFGHLVPPSESASRNSASDTIASGRSIRCGPDRRRSQVGDSSDPAGT